MINRKRKLLFMIDTLGGGGAERVLSDILKDLDRSLFEISLFLVIKDGVYVSRIPEDVPCLSIFRSTLEMPSIQKGLYRFYRRSLLELFKLFPFLLSRMSGIEETYDLGISFCEGHNTPLLKLKSRHFSSTIGWIHVDLRNHHCPLGKKRLGRSLNTASRICFVSRDARDGFTEIFPHYIQHPGMRVVYNPIDARRILQEAENAPEVSREGITLLAIGRLSCQKRFDKLLRVHRRLLDQGFSHYLWILGEGEDRAQLEAQARELDIVRSCLFLGFQNPYAYLKSADIFVMTSDYEGLPVAVCEAMILSKPIVSTRVTGPVELLEDGKYGLLVDNNESAIEKGLQKMILDEFLRDKYRNCLIESELCFIFPTDLSELEHLLIEV